MSIAVHLIANAEEYLGVSPFARRKNPVKLLWNLTLHAPTSPIFFLDSYRPVNLLLAHYFLFKTWTFGQKNPLLSASGFLVTLGILSTSFILASVLAFSYTNRPVRALYKTSSVWMGLLSFLFIAAVLVIIFGATSLAGIKLNFHTLVEVLFAIGLFNGVYGLFNASWTRITRIRVQLENLPSAWRGRKAALVSDVHLGHVRNGNFLQRLIGEISAKNPTQFSLPAN